jgi:hypothetical protein
METSPRDGSILKVGTTPKAILRNFFGGLLSQIEALMAGTLQYFIRERAKNPSRYCKLEVPLRRN